ncbi:MAG: serpin family protein [Clostridia bacterium]|nr:serpin family protein [Clostridia bacterium]
MKNKEQFKALVEERAAAEREAAALRARRRKIALRSAVAVVLALIILPVGLHLLGSPDLGGLSNNDMQVPDAPMEDGKEPPVLDNRPEQAPDLPEGSDDEDGDWFDPEEEGTPQAPDKPGTTQKPEGPIDPIDPEGPTDPDDPEEPDDPTVPTPPYSDDQPGQDSPVLESITDPVKGIYALNHLVGLKREPVADRKADDAFLSAYYDFAVKLFQDSNASKSGDNHCFSPLSVMLALSMAANGADGQTLAEMEALLGGGLSVDELNATLRTWLTAMMQRKYSSSTLNAANSIWVREGIFKVNPAFLQTNANYYRSDFYEAPFDDSTADDINRWINHHTNGMIEKMVNEIDDQTMMYLINTLYLDAVWESKYRDEQLSEGIFHGTNGDSTVTMMYAVEDYVLSMDGAIGFSKAMDGYSFVAILPDEGIDIGDFVASLTAGQLQAFRGSSTRAEVHTKLPSFSYDSSISLTDLLKAYIPSAMNPLTADFSKMGETIHGDTLYIGNVQQDVSIKVGKNGIAAAAGTVVSLPTGAEPPRTLPVYEITLDRPFVYLITDNTTGLPIFMGVVEQV